MRPHADKMLVVHAIWLCAYDGAPSETIEQRAADLLRVDVKNLWIDFDRDYLDRAWCSRPTDWGPGDSLRQPTP